MAGSGGGGINDSDWEKLKESAKMKLKEADGTSNSHVFISFAYEDAKEVNLLRGQAKSESSVNADLILHESGV